MLRKVAGMRSDEGKASRGSINMSVAIVSGPNTDKLKFNVDNKLGKSFPSFYLKGNRKSPSVSWPEYALIPCSRLHRSR